MLLGIGTGLSTVANLSLMFDLTVPGRRRELEGLRRIQRTAALNGRP
jgi:hypothetical protein